jgi:hypothetical protein
VSTPAVGLADFPELRRAGNRTLAVRLALLAAAVALFVLAFLVARGAGSEVGALIPSGTSPIVVLDVSASISGTTDRRVLATLQTLADSKGTAGLVVFSDSAYELLPPGAPTSELRPLIRYFVQDGGTRDLPHYPPNPWSQTFQSGTRISSGLDRARVAFARAHVHNASIILVSDLEDPENPAVLADSLAQLRKAHIELRIVPLFPLADNLALWKRLVGPGAIAASATLPNSPTEAAKQEAHPFQAGVSVWLLALSGLIVLVLAANERWCGRLSLAREEAG